MEVIVEEPTNQRPILASSRNIDEVLCDLDADLDRGLSVDQVHDRQIRHGLNVLNVSEEVSENMSIIVGY